MEPFNYDTLNALNTQIQLLMLHPGSWEEDIHCHFTTVSLDNFPEYETISYVWGDSTLRRPIIADGHCFLVTMGLEKALRRFRHPQASRIMWADAICINQQDSHERFQQVSVMGAIYEQCSEVQIWLGEENDLPLAQENGGGTGHSP